MSTNTARALWFLKPYNSEIRACTLPELSTNQVLIKSKYSAISPGTERLVFGGKVPVSITHKMKVPYMEGNFSFPIKYGYSLVGEVIRGPESYLGKRVQVMHPHQDKAVVNVKDLFVLSETISDKRATLISNMETCVNAIWDSKTMIGDRILVVGYGAIGSLLANVLRLMNYVDVTVVDNNPEKIRMAKSIGISAIDVEDVQEDTYDLSFHTSSNPDGLQTAIDAVGMEGKIIELSWYGTKKVNLHLGSSFHLLRKKIISSQVSTLPSHQQPRWDHKKRRTFASRILEDSLFDKLITSITPFNEIESLYSKVSSGDNGNLSSLIDFR